MSHLQDLGGPTALWAIINEFVDRVCEDMMIGFYFARVDKDQLKQREFEFSAGMLGEKIPYTGRPMTEAHARHQIMGGHFDRRSLILKEILAKHGVSGEITAVWMAHLEKLRPQITGQGAGRCA